MPASDNQPVNRALQLRAEALQICQRAAWTPQCIGTGVFDAGVKEIYAMRDLQTLRLCMCPRI